MTQFSVEKRHQAKGKGCVVVESFQECQQENEFSKANVTSLINSYPLKLMIPSHASENNSIWVYPVTFGGGLVGGDGIEMTFHVKPHCCAVITGQESTKVYHCEDALTTKQTTRGTVEDHALLCVMSDPVVCYRNSTFSQKQDFNMTSESSLVYLDWVIGGRVALNELWQLTSYENRTDVYIDGELVYRDNFILQDTPTVSMVTAMKNMQVLGSCIIIGKQMETIATKLNTRFGKKKSIGEKYDQEIVVSVSPLRYSVAMETVPGVYIRFMAVSSSKAYKSVVSVIAEN
ncbi:uncharacterized protein LOC128246687 isoform X1 [Mya arenaria]|uniref:uncharacterized protein LOC128246687 isoform X1 n=1 Tax=Mya arenaria TaxID=6604 RepID=UPI0022E69024|nr:uncharacterized protein LOC128246687 isoform X1 [Mya arenaria]